MTFLLRIAICCALWLPMRFCVDAAEISDRGTLMILGFAVGAAMMMIDVKLKKLHQ